MIRVARAAAPAALSGLPETGFHHTVSAGRETLALVAKPPAERPLEMNAGSVFPLSSFKFLLEASPTAIAISRLRDGVFVEVNDAFVLMTGYSRAELIGQTGQSLGLWQRSDERRRMLLEVKERGHVHHMAHEFRRKPGQLRRGFGASHRS